MPTLQVVVLDMTKTLGQAFNIHIPGTSDHDTVVARDSAVPIMDGTPNGVGLLINLYYHTFLCK